MTFNFDIELDFRLFKRWFFIKLLLKTIFILTVVLSQVKFMTIGRDGYEGYTEYNKNYRWIDRKIYNIISIESRASRIPERLTIAIISAESSGKQYAISKTGCIGYMQINPKYWHRHKPKELYQARMNIHYGTKIMAMYLKRYNYSLLKALKAYERGPNGKGYNLNYMAKIVDNLYKIK